MRVPGGSKFHLAPGTISILVYDFKGESTVDLSPSLATLRSFISAHLQPSIIWHSIGLLDNNIPDHAMIVGWVVSILSYISQILVVVEISANIYLKSSYKCNVKAD